jgi:hypothetical protein
MLPGDRAADLVAIGKRVPEVAALAFADWVIGETTNPSFTSPRYLYW